MPIFGYRCLDSIEDLPEGENTPDSHCPDFEVLYQNAAAVEREEPEEHCPHCGSSKIERIVINTGTSHTLKGRGWYKDGYT